MSVLHTGTLFRGTRCLWCCGHCVGDAAAPDKLHRSAVNEHSRFLLEHFTAFLHSHVTAGTLCSRTSPTAEIPPPPPTPAPRGLAPSLRPQGPLVPKGSALFSPLFPLNVASNPDSGCPPPFCGRVGAVPPPGSREALSPRRPLPPRSSPGAAPAAVPLPAARCPAPSPALLAMAAPAPLPAEELLPKGGAGKAEELEDELEEDDDDEEVAGRAAGEGRAGRGDPGGRPGPDPALASRSWTRPWRSGCGG